MAGIHPNMSSKWLTWSYGHKVYPGRINIVGGEGKFLGAVKRAPLSSGLFLCRPWGAYPVHRGWKYCWM